MAIDDPRNIALRNICDILEDKKPSHIVISESLRSSSSLSKEDRSFIKQLAMGTVEMAVTADVIIDRFSKVPVRKLKPIIRNILRMGVYQVIFLDTPDAAACNESVRLARKRGFAGLSGFVNGIMRSICRSKQDLINELGSDSCPVSLKYSMPEWITEHYISLFGEQKTRDAFEYFNRNSTTQIRCNISRIQSEILAEDLRTAGIYVRIREDDPKCMIISDYDRLESVDAFLEGRFTVQDYSAVLACEKPTDDDLAGYDRIKILDLCASPGGKTLNLYDRLVAAGHEVHAVACDISEAKLSRIRENIGRCQLKGSTDSIETLINDAAIFNPDFKDSFDIVIADVPCSGLGVIGRKPDIRYNMTPGKIEELVHLQLQILENAVRYIKDNGYLIFSTCTVGNRENRDNTGFILQHGLDLLEENQIIPGESDSDGFYYSLFRKR